MTATPEQAAAAEQAQREAAFERARQKLAAARCALPAARTSLTFREWTFIFLVVLAFLAFVVGAPLATYFVVPGANDPAQWSSNIDLPLGLFGPPAAFLVIAAIFLFGRKKPRGSEAVEEAQTVVLKFYAPLTLPAKPTGMAEHVIAEDLDDAPRRPVPFHSYVAPPIALRAPKDIDDYWKIMGWYDGKRRYRLDIEDSRFVSLADDLMQAHLTVAVRPNVWALFMVPFLLLILAMIGGDAIADHGGLFGSKAVGSSLAFLCAGGLLILWKQFPPKPVALLDVRKLIVRRAGEWLLFSGEWEGWEEADLSWLDQVNATAARAKPA